MAKERIKTNCEVKKCPFVHREMFPFAFKGIEYRFYLRCFSVSFGVVCTEQTSNQIRTDKEKKGGGCPYWFWQRLYLTDNRRFNPVFVEAIRQITKRWNGFGNNKMGLLPYFNAPEFLLKFECGSSI